MKTNKILVILVIVLVFINIGTLSFLWMGKASKKNVTSKNKQPQTEGFLKKKLKLDENQLRLFTEAREQHFSKSEQLMEKMRNNRKQLLQSKPDDLAIDSLLEKLTQTHLKIERLNYQHFNLLRSYCDSTQQKAFDSVMFKLVERQSNLHRKRLRKKRGK